MRELAFRAMGTQCRVLAYGEGSGELARLGADRVALLERTWSRFDPASELSRLNARAGQGPVPVSDDLALLVAVMRDAWAWTDGILDPTVLRAIRAAGYDADFATVLARSAIATAGAPVPSPGMGGVVVARGPAGPTVELPAGVGIDPGAIGKGLAGDIVVDELMAAGATGVLVDLGGDIVLAGSADGDPWVIAVAGEPDAWAWDPPVDRIAVCTSSTERRRWADGRHHVIDPRTGDIARGDLSQATVVAADGWRAEAAATCALVLGAERGGAWLADRGLEARLHPAVPTTPQLIGA